MTKHLADRERREGERRTARLAEALALNRRERRAHERREIAARRAVNARVAHWLARFFAARRDGAR